MKLYRNSNKPEVRLSENLKVSLEVRTLDQQGDESTLSLSSSVEKIFRDSSFLIQMPMYQNSYYSLPHNEVCLMHFTAKGAEGEIIGVFSLPVCFIERIQQENCVYARMEPVGDIVRHQRRECYRLPISLFISFKRVCSENPLPVSAKLIDFSDGGILLSTYERLKVGETLILDINIGNSETIRGTVIRTEPEESGKRGIKVAIKFNNTDRQQKQRFYRFIMEKQLEKRRINRWSPRHRTAS